MKFTGKAKEIAENLVELFRNGNPGKAMSDIFVKKGRHTDRWSFNNRLIAAMMGYTDSMGFQQWLAKGRTVKKGEKAFYILAPLTCKGKKEINGQETEYSFVRGFRGVPVFGYEQTEGEEIEFEDIKLLESLPLLEVAKSWDIKIGTYAGLNNSARGWFSANSNQIMLGVENISTWLHELVHAAEYRNGALIKGDPNKNRLEAEIVAELGSSILAHCIGLHDKADNGGCWEYICGWCKHYNKEPGEAAFKLVDRTCKAVNLILETYNELTSKEELCESL